MLRPCLSLVLIAAQQAGATQSSRFENKVVIVRVPEQASVPPLLTAFTPRELSDIAIDCKQIRSQQALSGRAPRRPLLDWRCSSAQL